MARRSARTRVAVVGAESSAGGLVRSALAEKAVPGERVDLYGATQGQTVVSEYDGEARVIQEPDPDEVVAHDVIFLCEVGDATGRILGSSRPDSLVIDMAGCAEGPDAPMLVHREINGAALPKRPGRLAVPHPLGIVLVELLHPLHRSFGVRQATAVVLRPASDFGQGGVEELREQTVRLLSFSNVPEEVFGGQLAFNLIPQRLLDSSEPDLEPRITQEVTRLLGWKENRLALRLVTAPIFHGHAVNLRVELENKAAVTELRDVLAGASTIDPPSDGAPSTPVEATGRQRITIAEPSEDGLGGFWLWAVAGEAAAAAAEQAVALAEAVGDL